MLGPHSNSEQVSGSGLLILEYPVEQKETEGAALHFFVCRTSNDYQDRMASSEGTRRITTKNGKPVINLYGYKIDLRKAG